MTKKLQVDLSVYRKRSRLLGAPMEKELREGGLYPILVAVQQDTCLRLDIRDRRFNVYYRGGSLLCVDGRKSPWSMFCDKKYFAGDMLRRLAGLPHQFSTSNDAQAWVQAFPALQAGMDKWWQNYPKGERMDCQAMAGANAARTSLPLGDYLVLDIEYQWAQRRFDMVAAERNPTNDDPAGWIKPDLVFVEVKSEYGACKGASGLSDHARDYRDIIQARDGLSVQDIKSEYLSVIAQKKRLGLLHESFSFRCFSEARAELLIVLVGLDPNDSSLQAPFAEVTTVAQELGDDARIRLMKLDPPNYVMKGKAIVPLGQRS